MKERIIWIWEPIISSFGKNMSLDKAYVWGDFYFNRFWTSDKPVLFNRYLLKATVIHKEYNVVHCEDFLSALYFMLLFTGRCAKHLMSNMQL